ncbi:MAG: GAF domain-containing SpoIIE family protein phosphatase, partial [Candidatus Limnocylindrales bacterium]
MASTRLDRLIDRSRLDALLEAAVSAWPGAAIRVLDHAGRPIAGSPGTDLPSAAAAIARTIVVDTTVIGSVEVVPGADARTAAGLADLVARAVELAATEGLGRRNVTAAAIDDLRELALLSRLSDTLGSAVDPDAIAGCVLSTVARPLGASVGFVLGPDDTTVLAASGDAGELGALRDEATGLLARLHGEDPALGSCAEVGTTADDRFGTLLAGFLRTARGHHGTIVLARPAGAAAFSPADRQLLASVAGQAAVAIERIELEGQVVARRALDQELAIGRRIQLSLMPRHFPEIDGWEIASAYEPAREVGGDFYDVFRLRDRGDCVGLVVADVTGKGIPAAILMADSRGLIHAAADHSSDPVDTLSRVNRILVTERASGLFVTVALAILDPATGRLTLARAGHDPVHVLRADGRLEILDPPGRLIGMVAELGLVPAEAVLRFGDAIVAHTDGITEARSMDGSFYGEDRFRTLLATLAGSPAAAIVAAVVADVAAFRGAAEP